jgi:hypothetical protein
VAKGVGGEHRAKGKLQVGVQLRPRGTLNIREQRGGGTREVPTLEVGKDSGAHIQGRDWFDLIHHSRVARPWGMCQRRGLDGGGEAVDTPMCQGC